MSEDHSVSRHIPGLIAGESLATQEVWRRYYASLVALAHRKLRGCPRRVLDEDDVVQVAFENFFRQVQQGRFARLEDRDDLWQILAMLVDRRAKDQFRKMTSEKNGNGLVRGDSINQNSGQAPVIDAAPDRIPTDQQAIEFAEQVELRLGQLKLAAHRKVALLKMARYTNQEIADEIDVSLRTVERMLEAIRDQWSEDEPVSE